MDRRRLFNNNLRGTRVSLIVLVPFFFIINATYSQSRYIADSLRQKYESGDYNDSTVIHLLNNLAYHSNNTDTALFYAQKLIQISNRNEIDFGLHLGYIQSGNVKRLTGDYVDAVDYYMTSLKYAQSETQQATVYIALGDVYSITSSHSNAIDYYSRAASIFRNIKGFKKQYAAVLINLGDELFNVDKLDSALSCFSSALVICEKSELLSYKANTLGNIGLVLAKLGKFDSAEFMIQQAATLLGDLGDVYPIAVYNTYMADIYVEKGEIQRALNYAYQSLKIGEEQGYKEQMRDASLKLSELYDRLGNYQEAFRFQKKYLEIRESINNERVIQEIADLRTQYEVSQKQAEVDILTAQKQTQRVIGFSLIGGLVLVLALAIIQYRNNIQKKKTNQVLRDQKTKLEELNQTKDRFFSIISHDLRGPVNAFHGVSRMIKFFVQQKQMGQLEELAEDIDQSVDRLSSLLDNLLNWAVQQQGNFPYVPEKLDIHFMAEDLVKTFTTMATSKQIQLVSEVEAGTDAWADRNTTMTIIRNLVGNALKFTPQEGEVKIRAAIDDESILIQVTDNGVGIPAEKLNDLFKLQAKKSTWGTDGEKGLGLGLQLVYDFVTLNKGKIDVESTPDHGTTFSVWLPIFEEVVVPENA